MENNYNLQAFFTLLRAGLWAEPEKQISLDCPVEWDEIYRQACEQSVLGLVLAGIDCLPNDQRPPKVLLLQWIGEIQMLEQRNREMNAFISELVERMRDAGIYTLLVKGQGIAQCYERPLWRSCGDVDFFLSENNYERAKEFLNPLASSNKVEGKYKQEYSLTLDPWVVELHGNMRCGLSAKMDKALDKIQREVFYGGDVRSWMNGKTQVFLPGINCDICFVFTHFLKHFYCGGIGLRQICDWSRLLWKYRDSVKIEDLEKHLTALGLTSEWKAFGVFAVDYLGMPSETVPLYSSEKKWRQKADRICKFIIKVGNFGQNRDMSYFEKYPYLVSKVISFGRRLTDLASHARLFPLDSIRFFPRIIINGLSSATRGE